MCLSFCVYLSTKLLVYSLIVLLINYTSFSFRFSINSNIFVVSFIIPDVSSSQVKNSYPDYYDVFALPLSRDAYIPNKRLRDLVQSRPSAKVTPDLRKDADIVMRSMTSKPSWSSPSGGSELIINDPNLLSLITLVGGCIESVVVKRMQSQKGDPTPTSYLAMSCKSEYCLTYNDTILLASEAKGREASNFECFSQGFQAGADSAINMVKRYGKCIDDAAIPVVICFGSDCFQILGVYLIPESFPCVTELSRILSINASEDVDELLQWIVVLRLFINETIKIISIPTGSSNENLKSASLETNQFFKPVYVLPKCSRQRYGYSISDIPNQQFKLSYIMRIFKLLDSAENSKKFILFPIGVIMVPGSTNGHNKGIRKALADRLSNFMFPIPDCTTFTIVYKLIDWFNIKPPIEFREAYKDALTEAVGVLNNAKIMHGDLRPTNIMWCMEGNEMKLNIIDFDDSHIFSDICEIPWGDPRYPNLSDNETQCVVAAAIHNTWFQKSVIAWIDDEANREFYAFMESYVHVVREDLYEELSACLHDREY